VSGSSGTATCAQGANQSAIKRGRRLPFSLMLIALLLGTAILQKNGGVGFSTPKPRSNHQWAQTYAALPLSFEANRGQTDQSVNFLSKGHGYTVFLTGHEAVLTLRASSAIPGPRTPPAVVSGLRLKLLGANPQPVVSGTDELPGKANYFIGNDHSKWRTNVPTYAKVRYQGVYPGVDLVYYGTQGGELEYDFVVAPGANPKAIALGIEAQAKSPLRVDADGNLVVKLNGGDVQLHRPVIYQTDPAATASASRAKVEGNFALDAQNRVRFELGPYDHSRALVIDPVLSYATYLGGGGGDIGYGIAIDSSDSTLAAYIAGVTNSSNFPTAGGAATVTYEGNGDAFVAKLNGAGTNLLYSAYVGGTGSDAATAVAVRAGSIFITGNTSSVDFPVSAPVSTAYPFQRTYGGNTDAFVTQINTDGSNIVYSSYLGGSGADFGQGIAVDSAGNAYVTGSTQSANFPMVNAMQSINKGSSDAFVTKVNFTGEALVYSTYLGGTSADVGQSIQVDSTGNAYIAGYTFSSDFLTVNVPATTPIQGTIGGGADAFVAKLKPDGSGLLFSTFVGGTGDDRAFGVALDSSLNVYIAGSTVSADFPVTSGVYQPALKGSSDAFVTKLNAAGSSLVYSTYLGGSGVDQANGIAVTPAGIAYVTGFTESSDFPTRNPIQSTLGLSNNNLCGTLPCADIFVTQLSADGSALTYSTYLGGNGPDFGQSIALDSTGDPYITGSTSSANFPAIAGSYSSSLTGTAGNAFIAKIDAANKTNISIVPYKLNFGNETLSVTSPLQQITIVNPSTAPLTITEILVGQVGTSSTVFTETDNCLGTIPAGSYCTMNVFFTPASTGQVTDTITITDNAGAIPGTEQIITLSGSGVTSATAVTVSPTSLSFSSQNVGTTSPAQNVTITNTGTAPLNITKISTSAGGDFSETDTCAAKLDTLSVGDSCNVSVFFSPTASNTRSASLTINDNAVGSPQSVSLTGIGAAAFTLTNPSSSICTQNCGSNSTVNPTMIGSTQTTFVIVANGPTSFNGAISLACSAGSTCAFNPSPIFVGSSTVMTISNLNTGLANPYAFTVTGTSGSQTSTLQLNLGFKDYTLTSTPAIQTIQAGTIGNFTIIVNPLNTFNERVDLTCDSTGLPPDATCTFSNSGPTPGPSSPSNVALTINTVKYVAPSHALPRFPNGTLPPLIFGLLSLVGLASLALANRRRAHPGWLALRLAALSAILALNLALAACRSSTLTVSGTTTGNYTITVSGTLHSNTAVVRKTTLNLAVTSSVP